MSDLLDNSRANLPNENKSNLLGSSKHNLLERSSTPNPETIYERSKIYSLDTDSKMNTPKKKKKTTTVRCSQSIANALTTVTTISGNSSIDETLGMLLSEHLIKLTDNERVEYNTLKKVYDKKYGL